MSDNHQVDETDLLVALFKDDHLVVFAYNPELNALEALSQHVLDLDNLTTLRDGQVYEILRTDPCFRRDADNDRCLMVQCDCNVLMVFNARDPDGIDNITVFQDGQGGAGGAGVGPDGPSVLRALRPPRLTSLPFRRASL